LPNWFGRAGAVGLGEFAVEPRSSTTIRFVDMREAATDTASLRYVSSECLPDWRIYSAYDFENLVLSGGGSKGYAYIGALKVGL